MWKAFKTIRREKKRQKKLKAQTQERQGYNKMQRGERLKPAERQAARSFMAKGKPKPNYR